MIKFSQRIVTMLAKPVIEAFYMVNIDKGKSCMSSHHSDVLFNGDLYRSDAQVVSVDPPQQTTVVDRQQFRVTVSDPTMEYGALAETGLVGIPISVYIAFVDVDTGQPILDNDAVITVYRGRIDGTKYSLETNEQGKSLFEIACTSPMGDLDATRVLRITQDFMDKNYPGDSSFSQVYQGTGNIYLRWGKA